MKGLVPFFKKNSATILTVVGSIGVVATSILTAKSAVKASKIIEKIEKEKGKKLAFKESFGAVWVIFVPSVMVGASTIACVLGANILNKHQQASLVSAYALIENSYREYKAKLKELYGEEAHNNIINAIATDKCKDIYISECRPMAVHTQELESDTEPRLFYDEYSGRYFESTIERVLLSEYNLNRNYILRGSAKLNEFYKFLGIDRTDYGEIIGWDTYADANWIDFVHRKAFIGDDNDGFECYIIEMLCSPG